MRTCERDERATSQKTFNGAPHPHLPSSRVDITYINFHAISRSALSLIRPADRKIELNRSTSDYRWCGGGRKVGDHSFPVVRYGRVYNLHFKKEVPI